MLLRVIACTITFAFAITLSGAPLKNIPAELVDEYTLGGKIPISYRYFDGTYSSKWPIKYKIYEVDAYIDRALRHKYNYYGETDLALYEMLDKYRSYIQGKTVGIIGSLTPWYESIVLAYGGRPVTVEYNTLVTNDSRLTLLTTEDYDKNPIKFDAILSISSIEHDGLGRYGDPIDPWGDIKAMKKMKEMLKEDGLLFLAIPCGDDYLVWNAHRIYGPIRLPLLFTGWKQIDYASADFQPVFVLRPNSKQP